MRRPTVSPDRRARAFTAVAGDHAHREMDARNADARFCRDLTRVQAANFYWGFIALPRRQRAAVYALYSFARQVDDDVDLAITTQQGTTAVAGALDRHRDRVSRCYAGSGSDPVTRVLSEVVVEFNIPRSDLESLVDGVGCDIDHVRYESWDELRTYCSLVASTVGRMCVRIFGYSHPVALDLADQLGLAMQLSNILRDVREDLERGRVYLPQADLRRFGITDDALAHECPSGWNDLVEFEVARARLLFESGLGVTALIPRRASACVRTMAGIYQAILSAIAQDPRLPLQRRVSLSTSAKASVMLKSWLEAL